MNAPELPSLTFPEAFTRRAAREPHALALHTVSFPARAPHAIAYSCEQLLCSAERAATALAHKGLAQGERVLLSIADPAEFFGFFFGAQCLGAIPVPTPTAADLPQQAYANRMRAIAADARPRLIVVDQPTAREALFGTDPAPAALCETKDLTTEVAPEIAARVRAPSCRPDEIAFLQYTSGSTGTPKGVVVLQRNLLANMQAIATGGELGPTDVTYSWLPLFHDMGLVAGMLLGMYLGIPTYVAKPKSFVYRPDSWLRAIAAFRASFSAGPNFAFDLLARRLPARALAGLDLSSWRLAFDGAELVDPRTARAFIERYAACGFRERSFRPAYGLAECTLAAAFVRLESPHRFDCVDRASLIDTGVAAVASDQRHAVEIASVGPVVAGHRIRVLEIGGARELPERHVGEIAISGPSVSPGYFAELSAGTSPLLELRTGDLGYLAHGELYVVDRIKDLLNIGGRKYSPAEIERLVSGIDGIRADAVIAFSVRNNDGSEDAYVVAGLESPARQTKPELARMIRSLLREQLALTPADVFLVRPSALPKTSSGKVMRSECAAMLADGRLRHEHA